MKNTLIDTTDARMLEIAKTLKASGRIDYEREFYETIGMAPQHALRIRLGEQHFTAVQIARACLEFNIDANWIMGLAEKPFRKPVNVAKDLTLKPRTRNDNDRKQKVSNRVSSQRAAD